MLHGLCHCPLPEGNTDADSEVLHRNTSRHLQESYTKFWNMRFLPVSLDASLTCGSFSAWCMIQRTKKYVVVVCKLWWETGTRLLYREMHLRRIGQIAALLNTLQDNARLGPMIMDINVSCQVMPQYFVMFDEALRRILEMSPNATRISLSMGICNAFISSTHPYDLSKLVHLDVGNEICFSDVLPCLPECKNLDVLSLSFASTRRTTSILYARTPPRIADSDYR
ncbi:hypothetical protein DFH29DRAFT_597498 [Suillus ampliporus]|nr:hypothetical protein DFH29DRAFT_597498 [Suillus ampliporus]